MANNLLTVACIPALDEEKNIGKVVLLAKEFVDKVIVCNDGSTDMTSAIARAVGAQVIDHEETLGKGAALRSLFKQAQVMGADILVTLDGDGQHDPKEIPKLTKALQERGDDIVIGSRLVWSGEGMPKHRQYGNKLLSSLTAQGITDTQSGFRAYGPKAIKSLMPAEMGMGADSELLMEAVQLGLKISETPVSVIYGEGRTSKHNPFYHTLDVIFSVAKLTSLKHPLAFYGAGALVSIIIGLYFALRAVGLYLLTKTLDIVTITYGLLAFAFLMIGLLTLFTGVILFAITTVIRKHV